MCVGNVPGDSVCFFFFKTKTKGNNNYKKKYLWMVLNAMHALYHVERRERERDHFLELNFAFDVFKKLGQLK